MNANGEEKYSQGTAVRVLLSRPDSGGINVQAKSLHEALFDFYETQIIYLSQGTKSKKSQQKMLTREFFLDNLSLLFKVLTLAKRLRVLHESLAREKSYVLLCMDPSTVLVAITYKFIKGDCRIIAQCHTTNPLLTLSDRFIIKTLFGFCDAVVVPSKAVKQTITALNSKCDPKVIWNMIPSNSCSNSWPRLQLEKSYFLYFGRLSSEKNPRLFIEMAQNDPENNYVMCGSGPLASYCIEEAAKKQLQNLEFFSHESAEKIMPRAYAMILPSKLESFGISVIEAAIQGVPILISDTAEGPSEILAANPSLGASLSPHASIDKWVETANKLRRNQLVENAIRNVLESYHPYVIAKDWTRVIAAVLDSETRSNRQC